MAAKPQKPATKTDARATETPKPQVGRPSSFNEQVAATIVRLAADGRTEVEISEIIGISDRTLRLWKGKHPELLPALKEAKAIADDLVEASLFRRATGYTHPEVKLFCHEGMIVSEQVEKHYPPDTTAAIFWLKNRRPKEWKDVQRLEHTGRNGGPVLVAPLTDDQIESAIGKLLESDEGGGFE
jgi:hypothetical protein